MGNQSLLEKSLQFNTAFVEQKAYEPFITTKYPDQKVAILTCMDTRLIELLPAAMGIGNGDAKIIKNAGAIISHPYGSVVRSLLVAIYELGVEEIWVVGHTDCGMEHLNSAPMIEKMRQRGISDEVLSHISDQGIDFEAWLTGFHDVYEAVSATAKTIAEHPLIPSDIRVEALVMDPITGKLENLSK